MKNFHTFPQSLKPRIINWRISGGLLLMKCWEWPKKKCSFIPGTGLNIHLRLATDQTNGRRRSKKMTSTAQAPRIHMMFYRRASNDNWLKQRTIILVRSVSRGKHRDKVEEIKPITALYSKGFQSLGIDKKINENSIWWLTKVISLIAASTDCVGLIGLSLIAVKRIIVIQFIERNQFSIKMSFYQASALENKIN